MQVFFAIFIPECVLTDGWVQKMALQREKGVKKSRWNLRSSGGFNASRDEVLECDF
jgi:hypothetical protein